MTAAEVCHELKISRAKLWQLVASGRLPKVKIDASTRFSRAAVDAFVAQLEAGGQQGVA